MTNIAPVTRTRSARAAAPAAPQTTPEAAPTARTVTSFAARKAGGMSVKERFSTLVARFKPEAAKGVDERFQFDLTGDGGGKWYVVIKDGKITVTEGTGPNPTATLKASASDYKKMAEGDMNKTIAFLRGKLKVTNKDALEKWDTYFKKA
ncbi:MAG: sterol-binding protein [Thermoleophilia bacterium]|jgi:putative sterol carrier protein|nr:sterol-binding protein [Thermoleophilia bacterium]